MCTVGEISFGAEFPVLRECSCHRNMTGKRRYCSPPKLLGQQAVLLQVLTSVSVPDGRTRFKITILKTLQRISICLFFFF